MRANTGECLFSFEGRQTASLRKAQEAEARCNVKIQHIHLFQWDPSENIGHLLFAFAPSYDAQFQG